MPTTMTHLGNDYQLDAIHVPADLKSDRRLFRSCDPNYFRHVIDLHPETHFYVIRSLSGDPVAFITALPHGHEFTTGAQADRRLQVFGPGDKNPYQRHKYLINQAGDFLSLNLKAENACPYWKTWGMDAKKAGIAVSQASPTSLGKAA